jgi:hypothetical protein
MSWNNVCVTLYTCNRPEYSKKTLAALAKNIKAPAAFYLHIADDGTDGNGQKLVAQAVKTGKFDGVTITESGHNGYGASYNLATQKTHQLADIQLAMEDDWEAVRPFDLAPLCAALFGARPPIDCIRLGYLGFTQELWGQAVKFGNDTYLLLDGTSSEPHVFAGHPRLETTAFQRRVGPWPTGLAAGATEFYVANLPEAREGVAWPMDYVRPRQGDLFAHIGTDKADEAAG